MAPDAVQYARALRPPYHLLSFLRWTHLDLTQAGSRLDCAPQDQGPLDQGDELHRQEHDGVCCSRGGDHRHLAHHSGNLLLQVFWCLFFLSTIELLSKVLNAVSVKAFHFSSMRRKATRSTSRRRTTTTWSIRRRGRLSSVLFSSRYLFSKLMSLLSLVFSFSMMAPCLQSSQPTLNRRENLLDWESLRTLVKRAWWRSSVNLSWGLLSRWKISISS